MEILHSDHDTPHAPGEFCARTVTSCYFFSQFSTPFRYEKEGHLCAGQPGDVLLQPPGSVVYHGWEEGGFVNTWLYLQGDELDTLLGRYPLPLNEAFTVDEWQLLRDYQRRVARETAVRSTGWQDVVAALTTALVIDLHRRQGRASCAVDRLESVREAVCQAPEQPWVLAKMARQCGYSPSRFSALYRARFGIAPGREILTARMALAQRMLRYTDRTVAQVAQACGFHSTSYFSKYYKRFYGRSPTDER